MTREEWLAAVAADRPPLAPAQIQALRAIFQPVCPQTPRAASARPAKTARSPEHERKSTADVTA